MNIEQSKIIPRIKLGYESVWWVLLKTLLLGVFLFAAVSIAAITQTSMSLSWLYSGGVVPLLSCPSSAILIGENRNLDGPQCKLFFSADSSTLLTTIDPNMNLFNAGYDGWVVYGVPCSVASGLVNPSKCQFMDWADDVSATVPSGGCGFNVSPVCDLQGTTTVGQILALRGLLSVSVVIVMLYLITALISLGHVSSTLIPARQRRLDTARGVADVSAKEMTKLVERDWAHLEYEQQSIGGKSSHKSSGSSRLVAETGHLRPAPVGGPKELFSTDQWHARVHKCLGTEARARRRVALTMTKIRTAIVVWLAFIVLTLAVCSLVLFVLPKNYTVSTQRSFPSVVLFNLSLLPGSLRAGTTWLDFAVIADLAVELILLMVSSLFVMQWPQVPVKVPHLVRIRNGIRRGMETDFGQAAADGAIYAESICAVIVCREACTSDSRRLSLVKRIQNLLTMFPPDSVFVVDSSGHSVVPVDSTWQTVHQISPLIRYCFVPDCSSKLFALHWFNGVWLPFLARSGQSQAFTHLLVLAAADDETPIPSVPVDVTIPRENLSLNIDNLRAMHFPGTAVAGSSLTSSCCLVPCQDIDLKFRALRRLAESRIGSCVETELTAATVWERDALYESLRGATATDGSPLQQLRSSLAILKLRDRNHIQSNPFSFIHVAVPSQMIDLMTLRIRNGHAGEIVKVGVALGELFSLFSVCNIFSWSVKPFLLLGTILAGLCQIMRPFVVGTLVYRDPLAIGFLLAGALILVAAEETLLLLVFSGRRDVRQKWSFGPLVLYPMYRLFSCWFIELPALCEYVLGGCVRNTALRPEKRFRELQDAPACPPCHIVNWFTVWKTEDDAGTEAGDFEHQRSVDDSLSSLGGFSSPRGLRRGA